MSKRIESFQAFYGSDVNLNRSRTGVPVSHDRVERIREARKHHKTKEQRRQEAEARNAK